MMLPCLALGALDGCDVLNAEGWLTEALALIGGPVDEHLGRNDGAERGEHLNQLRISEFLGQVVDEQIAAIRTQH